MDLLIEKFLTVINGNNFGYGFGGGDGGATGHGTGYGFGKGSGHGGNFGDGYGNGFWDGSGYGFGDGNGSGSGSGFGFGDGDGSGDGDGCGDGCGDGSNLKSYNNNKVYYIDDIPTVIKLIRGNIAKGFIVNGDLTTKDCYIAKVDNYFAHGETIKKALEDAQNKYYANFDVESKIKLFKEKFKDYSEKVKAIDLFNWHYILTGSCELGRENFCKSHEINIETDMFTINEFIELTKDNYGGNVIKQLI
jgi:hypothetical protein